MEIPVAKRKSRKKAAPGRAGGKEPMVERRADLGDKADGYFSRIKPDSLKDVAARLRAIVHAAAPDARESIKWGMPFYELNGMLGYIKAQRRYITLGFYHQGIHLADPQGRLEGTGKNMRHAKVHRSEERRG